MPIYRDVFDRAVQEGRKVQAKGSQDPNTVVALNNYQVVLQAEDEKFFVRDRAANSRLWEIVEEFEEVTLWINVYRNDFGVSAYGHDSKNMALSATPLTPPIVQAIPFAVKIPRKENSA